MSTPFSPPEPHALPAAATLRLATVWLAGCSGCHMAFLDLDEWLLELARSVEIVYSPLACDRKIYPDRVDVCLVEGAVPTATTSAWPARCGSARGWWWPSATAP